MKDTECPGESLRNVIACDPRDWGEYKRDAWLWGIVFGWEGTWDEMARRHYWTANTLARLKRLHGRFAAAFPERAAHPGKERGE